MSEKEIAERLLRDTAGLSAQAARLHLALVAGHDKNDIDGLARLLSTSRRSIYRWLAELGETTADAKSDTPIDQLAKEAQALADQVKDFAEEVSEMAQTAPEVSQTQLLPPHTPPTSENLTSPPPIVPPRRKSRRSSKFSDEETAMVSAIVGECNRLWGKRFSPNAHANYIIRRIRAFPDVTLEEHIEIVRRASAEPWWDGEPTPRVIYSRDDLFDSMRQNKSSAPRKTTVSERERRQKQLLGLDSERGLTIGHSENRGPAGIPLAGSANDRG